MVVARLTLPSPTLPGEGMGGVGKTQAQAQAQTQEENQEENQDEDELFLHGDGRNASRGQSPQELTQM